MVGEVDEDADDLTDGESQIFEFAVGLLQVSQIEAAVAHRLVLLDNDGDYFVELSGDLEDVVAEVLRNGLGVARGGRVQAVSDYLIRDLIGAASLLDKVRGLVEEVEGLEDAGKVSSEDLVSELADGLEGLLAEALRGHGLGSVVVEARNEAALVPVEAREVVLDMGVVHHRGGVSGSCEVGLGRLEE